MFRAPLLNADTPLAAHHASGASSIIPSFCLRVRPHQTAQRRSWKYWWRGAEARRRRRRKGLAPPRWSFETSSVSPGFGEATASCARPRRRLICHFLTLSQPSSQPPLTSGANFASARRNLAPHDRAWQSSVTCCRLLQAQAVGAGRVTRITPSGRCRCGAARARIRF